MKLVHYGFPTLQHSFKYGAYITFDINVIVWWIYETPHGAFNSFETFGGVIYSNHIRGENRL